MFVKNSESITDNLLVQFLNGEKRKVSGVYLFSTKKLALDYVDSLKAEELELLILAKSKLEDQITFTEKKYENLHIEDGDFL